MTPTIEAIGLHKKYLEGSSIVHAVRGVDLTIQGGRLMLLMGPSGSGKSSLLSMLGCILQPTAGELRINGSTVQWDERVLPTIRREYLGFVFQGFNLLSSLTAAENVAITLKLKGQHRGALKRAKDLLAVVGLADRCDFLPRDMSGGEKQRVAVARALIGNPSFILADEPTGNLDSTSGRVVVSLLRQIAVQQRRAVLVVSHDPRIISFADEVVHLEDGRIVSHEATTETDERGFDARRVWQYEETR